MHSTKHYQKAKDIKNGKFSKNKSHEKTKSYGKSKTEHQDRPFMGNTTMVRSIAQVSKIKETIRDKHLLKYIEPDAHLLDPGPEPDKPELDSIRDQIRVLERISLIDEYEESEDIDEYVESINGSLLGKIIRLVLCVVTAFITTTVGVFFLSFMFLFQKASIDVVGG